MGLLLFFWAAPALPAADTNVAPRPKLTIPRVSRAPTLEDFLEMKPNGEMDGKLAKVEGFLQRVPSDGQPSSQRTEAYLGYDDLNLYVVFVCFDREPGKIRARMVPREQIFSDDIVSIDLDTFHDERRAYVFAANPFGIQNDAIWTEGQGFDGSFDTLWHSKGKLTEQGYVVWMAIPFKSLRFSSDSAQTWGLILNRDIPRLNEETYWPHYSSRIEGRLNQTATLNGLERISPGRNIQFIPFGVFRTFRALDESDPNLPRFREKTEGDAGLDAKFVFKDSLVLDVALNPDFSQVESDEPQVTVGQRFEVFFPEKRPFFIENASYFQTPIDLLFTRRIADPQFGVRLTGKLGRYALGAIVIDDEAPGKSASATDPLTAPLHGQRALFSIVRVNRDLGKQSTLGFIFSDREFEESFNRLGGVDGRFKLSPNWTLEFQAVTSSTRCLPAAVRQNIGPVSDRCFFSDPEHLAGPAYDAELTRSGRQLFYNLEYNDRSPGYRTAGGFLTRPDIRRVGQFVQYRFRPEGKYLISWGPASNTEAVFDHDGLRLDLTQDTTLSWEFIGESEFGIIYNWDRERLRPKDFSALAAPQDFSRHRRGFFFTTSYFRQVTFRGNYSWGSRINFTPPSGQPPFLADVKTSTLILTLRPLTPLRVDHSYLFFGLRDRGTGGNIFNNHILRSKWNWQFNRELSLRVILQYDATLANNTNPNLTSLETRKNFNADFLLTYLVNPGTALFIGYNGNAQNIDLVPTLTGSEVVRRRDHFINDGKQFFIKFSYLIRF